MKERPIMFSEPMVQAVEAGFKTQTRRLVRWPKWVNEGHKDILMVQHPSTGLAYFEDGRPVKRMNCPFGTIYDRLWVRETWGRDKTGDGPYYRASEQNLDIFPKGYWKPSIHMKRADSRFNLEIEDLRVHKLCSISEEDAIAEGAVKVFGGWTMTPKLVKKEEDTLRSAKYAFLNFINLLHGGPNWNFWYSNTEKYPKPLSEINPEVWAIKFKMI